MDPPGNEPNLESEDEESRDDLVGDPGEDLLDAGLGAYYGRATTGIWEPKEDSKPRERGDFRILREIGRGGMGVVYLAEQISLQRRVALKILQPSLSLQFDAVARFKIEAASAARLRHPGIVQIYSIGRDDGDYHFAMELIEGSPLQEVIAQLRNEGLGELDGSRVGHAVATAAHRVSRHSVVEDGADNGADDGDADRADVGDAAPGKARENSEVHESGPAWCMPYIETVCRMVIQVADALQHAHDAGVIHRDVKPSNILVREDGSVVLTDFGLARAVDMPSVTQSAMYLGTPMYSSPEQASGKNDAVDYRSDVFSLGVTLYELLTLNHPFVAKTSQQILENVIQREPANPRRIHRKIPRDLATILAKALEKSPERRYQSAAEFGADLGAFLAMEPIAARPASAATKTMKFVRRHRWASAASTVALCTVVTAAVWWMSLDGELLVDADRPGLPVMVARIDSAGSTRSEWRSAGSTNEKFSLTLGEYDVRVDLPDGTADSVYVSQLIRVSLDSRGDRRPYRIKILEVEEAVEAKLFGSGEQWVPEERLREAIDARIDKEIESLIYLLRSDRVELVQKTLRGIRRLGPGPSRAGRVTRLIESAQKNKVSLQREESAFAGQLESRDFDRAAATIARVQEIGFESGAFGPASDCTDVMQQKMIDALKKYAGEIDSSPGIGDAKLQSDWKRLVGFMTRFVDADDGTLEKWKAQLDRVTSRLVCAEGLLLVTAAGRDRDELSKLLGHPATQVRTAAREAIQRVDNAARLADVKTIGDRLVRDFEAGDLELLRDQQKTVSERHKVAKTELERSGFASLEDDIRRASRFLQRCRDVDARLELDLEDATDRFESLELKDVGEKYRKGARVHLARLEGSLRTRALRLAEARGTLRKIRLAIDELDHEKARMRRSALEVHGFRELESEMIEVGNKIRRLEKEEKDVLEMEGQFDEFLGLLRSRNPGAKRKLEELSAKWKIEIRRLGSALGTPSISRDRQAELLLRRARLHLRLGDEKECVEDAKMSSELSGTVPARAAEAYVLWGLAEYASGDPAIAKDRFGLAVQRDESNARAYYGQGLCLQADDKRSRRAGVSLGKAITRGITCADAHYRIAILLGERDHAQMGSAERKSLGERMVKSASVALDALWNADMVITRLGGLAEALKDSDGVRNVRRDTLAVLGRGHFKMGNYASARQVLQEATSLDPEFAIGFYHLGFAYVRQAETNQARIALQTAIKLAEERLSAGRDIELNRQLITMANRMMPKR